MPVYIDPAMYSRRVREFRCAYLLSLVLMTLWFFSRSAAAQDEGQRATSATNTSQPFALRTHRSRNFIVHTDVGDEEAKLLIERLEQTLRIVASYWNRNSQGAIECYVAKDVLKWPAESLPHPMARILIARVGGVTVGTARNNGNRVSCKAIVLASAQPGVAEHEIVHAYCLQTFGQMGPVWYKEGMAEMACQRRVGKTAVCCPAEYVPFFQKSRPRSVGEVVRGDKFTNDISESLLNIASDDRGNGKRNDQVPLKSWTKQHAAIVTKARESYRWSWAVCHFLCNHPQYAERFRALGQSYLTNRGDAFQQAFAAVERQVEFEFNFFIKRFNVGYRVDLCHWDWDAKFRSLSGRSRQTTKVDAARGFQASGVMVAAGNKYAFRSAGRWTTNPREAASNANGNRQGRGRVVGIVLNDKLQFSEPFDLGVQGSFTAPCEGRLYLRCNDAWHEIADNQGSVTVRIQLDHSR